MKSPDNLLYLEHILHSIQKIENYTHMGQETFLSESIQQDAVLRNFEVIGEASRKVTEDFQIAYPSIPWAQMIAFRNRIIHNYDHVNLHIVWKIIQEELPLLKTQIQTLYDNLNQDQEE